MPFQDPNNLIYFLTENPCYDQLNILQEAEIQNNFFSIKAAIIGSSHFLYIQNDLFEILSCNEINASKAGIIQKKQVNTEKFFLKVVRKNYSYDFNLESKILDKKDFNLEILKISEKKNWLYYNFQNSNALTIIDYYFKDEYSVKINTWHTYPEKNAIVFTETLLNRVC